MPSYSIRCALLLVAVAACFFAVADAHAKRQPKRCCLDGRRGWLALNLTCAEPLPYCCSSGSSRAFRVFCCNDCKLSLDSNDCNKEKKTYWKYMGYGIGGLALLFLVAGLIFGLVRLIKKFCCKRRSTTVRAATGAALSGSPDYPRNIDAVPEWQQPPKRPPEYYDVFAVSPPPAYKERPDTPAL